MSKLLFQSTYRKFCQVDILHDYFLVHQIRSRDHAFNILNQFEENYDIRNWLSIEVSPFTRKFLSDHRMVFHPTANGFELLIEAESYTDSTITPVIPPRTSLQLEFWIKPILNDFFHASNLPFSDLNQFCFYFSNLADNVRDGHLYLSQPLPIYSPGTTYHLGDLVRSAANPNRILESQNRQSGFAETDSSRWWNFSYYIPTDEAPPPERTVEYTTALDQIPCHRTRFFIYEHENTVPLERLAFTLENATGQITQLGDRITTADTTQTLQYSWDLNTFPPGYYELRVIGDTPRESISFVYQPDTRANDAWGMVYLFFEPSVPSPYPLSQLSAERIMQLVPRTYVIRIKSRTVTRRYRWTEEDRSGEFFLSFPLMNSFAALSDSLGNLLPDPLPTQLTPERDATDGSLTHMYADIFVYDRQIA